MGAPNLFSGNMTLGDDSYFVQSIFALTRDSRLSRWSDLMSFSRKPSVPTRLGKHVNVYTVGNHV